MKKLIAILALGALVATGAFAELSLGISGVQYYQEDENGNLPSLQQAWKDFQDGTGVYYGGFGEILGKHWGLGLAFNYDPEAGSSYVYNNVYAKFMSYDVNLYLSYHLFGGAAFLDPFVEAGFGMTAFDYLNKDELNSDSILAPYVDDDDPLFASAYTTVGIGLGLNLKPIGVFFKANWVKESKNLVKGTYDSDYPDINLAGKEYYIEPWFVMPFRWTFGAKLLLF
uniref:Outer membrane protein beta-barrel domain-containing protein n=1 Tax=Gracilinema caldarium TaxID=215591 RepID=A0A7C3EAQ0_9SPIR